MRTGGRRRQQCRTAAANHARLQDCQCQAWQATAQGTDPPNAAAQEAQRHSQARRSPRTRRAGYGQARHGTQAPDRHQVAYQAESELIALMRPHYARIDDEGRTLLHELFATAGDIRVSNSELQITLAPLSSPHRTLAAQALCDILNKTATVFPGSSLRMRFAVHPPRRIGLAFPGSPGKRGAEKVAVAAA